MLTIEKSVIFLTEALQKMIKKATFKSELLRDIEIPYNDVSVINVKKGEFLNALSDSSIILILKGQVDVYSSSFSGDEVYLSTLNLGDCIGVSNVFNKSEITTNIKCASDVEILIISEKVLSEIMQINFALVSKFLTLYNNKIQFLLERIESLTIQSARAKLVFYLLKNKGTNNCVKIKSKQQLAEFLGISKASLYREIAFLKTKGVIEAPKGFIYILNETEIKEFLF